jgi:hypothetical protein
MAELRISTSMSAPSFPPAYDPRVSNGMSLHINNSSGYMYIGLSRTGSAKWAAFNPGSSSSPSGTNPTPPVEPAFIHVTTSSDEPDFAPFCNFETENAIHFHVVYGTTYKLCVGMSNIVATGLDEPELNWAVYDADATIS